MDVAAILVPQPWQFVRMQGVSWNLALIGTEIQKRYFESVNGQMTDRGLLYGKLTLSAFRPHILHLLYCILHKHSRPLPYHNPNWYDTHW